jgi:hypothetical protein
LPLLDDSAYSGGATAAVKAFDSKECGGCAHLVDTPGVLVNEMQPATSNNSLQWLSQEALRASLKGSAIPSQTQMFVSLAVTDLEAVAVGTRLAEAME